MDGIVNMQRWDEVGRGWGILIHKCKALWTTAFAFLLLRKQVPIALPIASPAQTLVML